MVQAYLLAVAFASGSLVHAAAPSGWKEKPSLGFDTCQLDNETCCRLEINGAARYPTGRAASKATAAALKCSEICDASETCSGFELQTTNAKLFCLWRGPADCTAHSPIKTSPNMLFLKETTEYEYEPEYEAYYDENDFPDNVPNPDPECEDEVDWIVRLTVRTPDAVRCCPLALVCAACPTKC